jgi:hypothetical protein
MIFRRAGLALPEKTRSVRAVEIFCLALAGRVFMGDFFPSALRWAVTRRPCGAFSRSFIFLKLRNKRILRRAKTGAIPYLQ